MKLKSSKADAIPESPAEIEADEQPYFNESGTVFVVQTRALGPEEFKKKFIYIGNVHAEGGSIWTTMQKGPEGGTDLASFLIDLQHAGYAFGPAKPNRRQSQKNLTELNAVGLYKMLPEEAKASQKAGSSTAMSRSAAASKKSPVPNNPASVFSSSASRDPAR